MTPKVSVIIVNWNGGKHLPACLDALRKQSERDFRVVVVDNASSDGSQRLVGELGDERFRLLQLDRNLGYAAANNLGVQASGDSPWIALLNPDAFPATTWLAELLAAAARHPEAAAFGSCQLDASNPTRMDGTGDAYHLSGRAFRRDHGREVARSTMRGGPIVSPCGAAALYSRAAWVSAGGMDSDFFCYMEDVDLGLRLQLLGFPCRYVPEAVCLHVGSGITGRRSEFSCYYGQRNLVWTYVKNMPSALLWLTLPLHLAANLIALVLSAARGQLGVALRANRDALRGLPGAWRKRREIQQRRKLSVAGLWRLLDKRLWPRP